VSELAERLAADNQRLCAEMACLRVALADAIEDMEGMVGYIPDYFVEKWGYRQAIQAAKDALKVS